MLDWLLKSLEAWLIKRLLELITKPPPEIAPKVWLSIEDGMNRAALTNQLASMDTVLHHALRGNPWKYPDSRWLN